MMKSCLNILGLILCLAVTACATPTVTLFPDTRAPLKEFTLEGKGVDKVVMIPISGTITHQSKTEFLRTTPSTVQEIVAHLNLAEKDPHVKAVLLKIDSPGGSATASDLLYHEILEFKKRTGKPVVAAMMNIAASGGYYIALPADAIIAHPTTITGSVGVIFMRPAAFELAQKLGIGMTVSKSGVNKDMGSPFRKQTAEEKAIFQNITDQLGRRFLDLVAKHRHLPPEKLKEIATARVFLADEALKLGMIDGIGYLDEALGKAKGLAKLAPDAKVVVYRRSEFKDDNLYNLATRLSAPGPDLSLLELAAKMAASEPGFYYMWSPNLTTP